MATGQENMAPQCIASTSSTASPFTQAQFSGDGTTIVTLSADHTFRTFFVPENLLDATKQPHTLTPSFTTPSPSAVQSYALYPKFDYDNPSTRVFLTAATDLPITLTNVVEGATHNITYPLYDATNEKYLVPKSLVWTPDGERFIAGSLNQISIFDVRRYHQGPLHELPTTNSKKSRKIYGRVPGCIGHIMGLSINSTNGMLAAGTTEREVALYDGVAKECWSSFTLPKPVLNEYGAATGITQTAWSPEGTYLFAAERQSNGVHVYDIRNTQSRVSFLAGRNATTPQRMGFNITMTARGYELWAGGIDGCVRMWKNPGSVFETHHSDAAFKMHDSPVSSAVWHPEGWVMATCAGKDGNFAADSESSGGEPSDGGSSDESVVEEARADNSLKIWTV
ncbi:uncharacterized protein LTR77_009150 [Saxophila tyrrhenica]|uniref:WD40 repeat-like protein n=1 Tax=Saxophila tyrrhenica TaxID=1690608 RepID=A0AAV9P253_9PEZI|nr:hypothetical protein LTR77_009150 [Saxophila tyrrhenica]